MRPRSLEEAFDLSTPEVQAWEVEWIQEALVRDEVIFSYHAIERLEERRVSYNQVYHTLLSPDATHKDLPEHSPDRQVGINFSRAFPAGERLNVKVGFQDGYAVITLYWTA